MKNEYPLISVIVPVYNVEAYLKRCVDSIRCQTYSNIEIILVDDGSPDNCPQMCDDFASEDSRIKVVHKANGGLSDARNCGIDASSGEYITLIDSDDYVTEDMVEVLYNRITLDESDMVLCNYLCVGDNGDTSRYAWENEPAMEDELLSSNEAHKKLFGHKHWHYVIACCKLYKRFLFDDFRYPLGKLHEDLHTTHLLFEKCSKISCVKKPLYYYYQNESSITHTYSIRRLDAVDAYISRFHFYYDKQDYYCAIMSVEFMIPKMITAHNELDLTNEQARSRLDNYKKEYKKLLKKVFFKKVSGVPRIELISFYFGYFPYRVYNFLRNRINKLKG